MAIERCLHDAALHPSAAAVHDAHPVEPGGGGRVDVLGNHGRDIPRREGVQIDLTLDRQFDRVGVHRYRLVASSREYSAVTIVLIPPRTEKSPTTVIRRG
jgi:hypothetical protein